MSWLTLHEPTIRLSFFLGILAIMLCWESTYPKRKAQDIMDPGLQNWQRRLNNFGLSLINTLCLRVVPFLSATLAANWATHHQTGFLNWLDVPFITACISTILFLDLMIYLQHRVFHSVPALWRLHRVHHSDEHIDCTTALRFHPIEIILSMLIKIVLVILWGAPVEAVILFEIILNGCALFNHANIPIYSGIEKKLRWLIVTPDMHRIHHSIYTQEMNQNFGFNLSIWDRLFGSYCSQPKDGQYRMKIGLPLLRGDQTRRLKELLTQPLLKQGLEGSASQKE